VKYLILNAGTLPTAANGGMFVSPGYGIHCRRVIESFEIILLRQGSLQMAEQDRCFDLHPGDVLLLYPGCEHRGLSPYDHETSFYWLHFHLPAGVYQLVEQEGRPQGDWVIPQQCHPLEIERLIELLRRFLHRQEQSFYCPMEADLLVAQIVLELAFQPEQSRQSRTAAVLAAQARQCIDQHCLLPALSPGDVAARLQFNADYLGRVFKQVYHETMGNYLNRQRLRKARHFLLETPATIDQIALKSGYHDPAYFRRLFKKQYDITPSQWRRLHSRRHINIS